MKSYKILTIFITLFYLLATMNCSDSQKTEEDAVKSIFLVYYGNQLSGDHLSTILTADISLGSITFTANVEVTGKASKDFTLISSNTAVAAVSGKTVNLISGGQTVITAVAVADSTKRHTVTLNVTDPDGYIVNVTGGNADRTKAPAGQVVTLTAETIEGMKFVDWTIVPAVTFVSGNQFLMPASPVTVTGNFENEPAVGTAPYFITNNFAEDSSTAFLVQWHHDTDETQTLQIVDAAGNFANAREIQVTGELWSMSPSVVAASYPERYIFRTEVSNLQPSTVYKYRVGSPDAWSQTFFHLTSKGVFETFSFTVASDPQTDDPEQMVETLSAANDFDNDNRFFVLAGDIVDYPQINEEEFPNYTKRANELNVYRPIAATQGNHDTYLGQTRNDNYVFNEARKFNAFLTFSANGRQAQAANHRDLSHSYYFYYNEVLIVMLNSMISASASGHAPEAAWLREVLSADRGEGKSRYTIIVTHVGPFAGREVDRYFAAPMREAYRTICNDFNVDIFFSGHDHLYARSYPIKVPGNAYPTTAPASDDLGTVYSIVSAVGPKLYDMNTSHTARVSLIYPFHTLTEAQQEPGMFVNVKVTEEKLIVTAMVAGQSEPFDTYEVPVKPQ